MKRLEERVAAIKSKLDRMALRSEVIEIRERIAELERRVAELEAEIG